MTLTIAYILLSALGWSLFDISRKKSGAKVSPLRALQLYMLFSLPLTLLWMSVSDFRFATTYWLWGTVGIGVNFLANWTFIESVKRSPLSLCVPMLAFVPAFSALFSHWILGETLNFSQSVGIGLVVMGAFVLNGLPKLSSEERGPWVMFVAAMFWAMMLIVDKLSMHHTVPAIHITIQTIGILVCATVWLALQKRSTPLLSDLRAAGGYFWLGIIGCVMGAGLQLLAISQIDVGVLESVKRAANMMFSFAAGAFFFSEQLSLRKVLALGTMLGGTFLVLQVV